MANTKSKAVVSPLAPLPESELKKVEPLSEERIRGALAEGREHKRAAEANAHPVSSRSRLLFR